MGCDRHYLHSKLHQCDIMHTSIAWNKPVFISKYVMNHCNELYSTSTPTQK